MSVQLTLASDAPESGEAPTPEQRRAIDARDRDVLLEAGAGTGKTLVLVERYCAAAEAGAGVDGILAFTFTERAAAELRGRIREELADRSRAAAARGEAERAAKLATISRDSERAWISTIHGFCRRLIAAQPVALGLDPRFRVLDAPEADRVARRAFDGALRALVASGDPEAAALAAAVGIGQLLGVVRAAHDELRSMGFADPVLPPAPPSDPAAAIRDLVGAAREALNEAGGCTAKAVGRIERAAELDPDEVHQEAAVARLELNSGAKALAGPACRRYREVWATARRVVAEHESADRYSQLTELVRLFGERYAALKEERSGLDFEDLQHEAVRLLRERPGIADTYRERFQHLMVDEFQDTNQLQLSLIRELAGPDTRTFAVGDEFQSIYGFRHADLRVFRRERERVRNEPDERAELMQLSGNFRSVPGVIAAANFLGGALLEGFRPLTVARRRTRPDPLGDGAEVELLLTPGGKPWKDEELGIEARGEYPSPPDRVAEARFLAARLADLRRRGVPAGRMVVLLRALTHVTASRTSWSGRGWRRTWSAAAGTGPSSRWTTSAGCWGWSRTRSTTTPCSARSRHPPAACSPTRCGCCARRRGRSGICGRRWSATLPAPHPTRPPPDAKRRRRPEMMPPDAKRRRRPEMSRGSTRSRIGTPTGSAGSARPWRGCARRRRSCGWSGSSTRSSPGSATTSPP